MALPVPVKTWLISPNNTLPTNGSSNTDYTGRSKDVADFFGTLITSLLSLGAGNIVVIGSSDGRSNIGSPPIFDGTNYWLPSTTNFRDSFYDLWNNGLWDKSIWIVLEMGSPGADQIAISFTRQVFGTGAFEIYWSPSGAFAPPLNNTRRPEAPDQVMLTYSYASYVPSYGLVGYGIFNKDFQGIIN